MEKKAKKEKAKIKAREEKKEKTGIFRAVLAGERVFCNASEAFTLYEQSRFGEPKEGKVYYSLAEALYLVEKGKLQIYKGKKKISLNAFMQAAQELEKNFHTRFIVFRDMRNRGYIIKTALKFGADFRVYERGVKPGDEHAKWISILFLSLLA